MPTKPTIQDQTFLFTGTLTEFTRDEAEALVEANGGKILSGVSAKLNYLVVGADAGSKLEKAKALGTVTILTEKEFLKMMSSGKKKPTKATPKKSVKATAKADVIFKNFSACNAFTLATPKKIAKSTAKVNSVSKQDKAAPKKTVKAKFKKEIPRNEVVLNCGIDTIYKLVKKFKGVLEKKDSFSKKKLKFIEEVDDETRMINFDDQFVNYLMKENKLFFRLQFCWDIIFDDKGFFEALTKLTDEDFRIDFWSQSKRAITYCKYSNGEFNYEECEEYSWYGNINNYPYFLDQAKMRGLIDGEDGYDEEEQYNIFYDFVDEYLSSYDGTEMAVAPDWYKS